MFANPNVLDAAIAETESAKPAKKSDKLGGFDLRRDLRTRLTPEDDNLTDGSLAEFSSVWTHHEAIKNCITPDQLVDVLETSAKQNADGQVTPAQLQNLRIGDDRQLYAEVHDDDRFTTHQRFDDWSASQLFSKLDLPTDFHRDRRLGHDDTEIGHLNDILNHRYQKLSGDGLDNLFLRTRRIDDSHSVVRACLSEGYGCISDVELVKLMRQTIDKHADSSKLLVQGFNGASYERNHGQKLRFNLLVPDQFNRDKSQGAMLTGINSETGRGSYGGWASHFSSLCANGMITGLTKLAERTLRHIGKPSAEKLADIFTLAWSDVANVQHTFDQMDALKALGIEGDKMVDLVNVELERSGLNVTREEKAAILSCVFQEAKTYEDTAYSVVNGITRFGHTGDDSQRSVKFEFLGGELFARYVDRDEWDRTLDAIPAQQKQDKQLRAVLTEAIKMTEPVAVAS